MPLSMPLSSHNGKVVIAGEGPVTAEIVLIGESPTAEEILAGKPFVGRTGKMLNAGLRLAGIDRSKCRILYLIPFRAPGDKFANHTPQDVAWGQANLARELANLRNARVYLCLGAYPTSWLCGGDLPTAGRDREGFIGQWRGSVIPVVKAGAHKPENYLAKHIWNHPKQLQSTAAIVPTYHPADILRQFNWHPWLVLDLKTAACIAEVGLPPVKYRKWYYDNPTELLRLANHPVNMISVDTEMEPPVVSIATDTEVHVFTWNEQFRPGLTKLLTNPVILKVAHNWLHDSAWIRKQFGIGVSRPIYDTQGAAHNLNNALQKELSPHIATRYTNWSYHKWLTSIDQLQYCGMDSVVCYDAYWTQMDELHKRGLYYVADHDHKLLTPLMDMQAVGFAVDQVEQPKVAGELQVELDRQNAALQLAVQPIIDKQINSFQKPHLFRVQRKCVCCGGGKTQMQHCLSCGHGDIETKKLTKAMATGYGFKTVKALQASLPPCVLCKATGKITKSLEFNSDSPDQLADVVYRGLKIKARRFKGKETTKAAQLDPIKDKHPVIGQIVEVSKVRADYDTVARLRTGTDGLLHCVFDPFGTGSGRVAGKEGLVEVGTNPMNLPIAARRLVVPRPGKIFLYPDKAQIEARAVAVLSKDKNLYDALTQPIDWPGNKKHGHIDSHTRVVQLFDRNGVTITRDQAKRFTYAGIYGGGAKQLAVELNAEAFRKGSSGVLTVPEVQQGLDTFFRAFPRVKQWQLSLQDEVLRTRKLRCPFTDRERTWVGYIYDSKTKELKHEIAKQAMSYLPQNMGAWILALDLLDIVANLGYITPLVHVHDAVLLECPADRLAEGVADATTHMSRTEWGMFFPAEMKVGRNWLEASTLSYEQYTEKYA